MERSIDRIVLPSRRAVQPMPFEPCSGSDCACAKSAQEIDRLQAWTALAACVGSVRTDLGFRCRRIEFFGPLYAVQESEDLRLSKLRPFHSPRSIAQLENAQPPPPPHLTTPCPNVAQTSNESAYRRITVHRIRM